jgi:hypothetical protein
VPLERALADGMALQNEQY